MAKTLEVVVRPHELRERVAQWRRQGERIAFVPTMGNLHAGHGTLVSRAARAGRSRHRQRLRQSVAVRSERRFRGLSAHAATKIASCCNR